jgi:Spy/CpxP family protein refolding chaperone
MPSKRDSLKAAANELAMSKRGKIMLMEERVKQLEEENVLLKSQLRVGKEPVSLDDQARQELTSKLEEMVNQGAPDQDIKVAIKQYVIQFSDYGTDRSRIVQKHMDQLDRLLAPTQISKLCMWSLHQDDEFFRSTSISADGSHDSLWAVMCREIEATPEQQDQFKKYRENAIQLTRELRFTNRECQDLRHRLDRKNLAFANEMAELSKILTPTQIAKFVLFVSKNHASSAMLSRLWDSECRRVMKASMAASHASTSSPQESAAFGKKKT